MRGPLEGPRAASRPWVYLGQSSAPREGPPAGSANDIVDLYAVLVGLDKMLRRIVGEDIEFAMTLQQSLGHIQIDPSSEQVIMNLVVNARDACLRVEK